MKPPDAQLLAALPVAVLLVDPADRIAATNAAAEQLLNVSERLMVGRPLAAVLPPPHGGARDEATDYAAFDAELETARGQRLRVDFREAELPDHPGWRAITLHPAPRVVAPAGARAATGAAAMLAHEIKNPLSGIRGAAQLLGSDELPRLIVREVDRIAALIDRMQEFGDTRPLATEGQSVFPVLDHARAVAQAGFARDIAIEERFDPSLPPARINADALTQVVLNLLKNAAEALAGVAAPRIALAAAYRPGMAAREGATRVALPIEVCVLDNGPGAAPEVAEHLFEPFVSGRPDGQGLGLPLVEKLVRDMGGLVQYAREGAPPWTVLRVLLPRAA